MDIELCPAGNLDKYLCPEGCLGICPGRFAAPHQRHPADKTGGAGHETPVAYVRPHKPWARIFRLQIGIQTRAIKIAATMLLMCAIAVAGLWVWYTTRLAATEWDGAWDWTIAAVSWKYLLYDFDGIRVFTEDGWRTSTIVIAHTRR